MSPRRHRLTPVTCVRCGYRGTILGVRPGVGQGANNGNLGTCINREACDRRKARRDQFRAYVKGQRP